MNNSTFRIFSWNCRSIYNKLSKFKLHIYITKPHIICLTETWLRDSREPHLVNYTPYFKHRESSTGGGLAIFVRNDLMVINKCLDIFEEGKLEIQALTVVSKLEKIDIMNIYNPNENISKEEFIYYFNQLNTSHVITGDFNAHHNLWDNINNENITGKNLADVIYDCNNVSLLTPLNFPTHHYIQNNSYSTLDLTFLSNNLFKYQIFLKEKIWVATTTQFFL